MQGYGMTEASPMTNVNPLDAPREGTVGPPVADTLEKVVSLDDGRGARARARSASCWCTGRR